MAKTILIAASVSFLGAVLISYVAGLGEAPGLGGVTAHAAPAEVE